MSEVRQLIDATIEELDPEVKKAFLTAHLTIEVLSRNFDTLERSEERRRALKKQIMELAAAVERIGPPPSRDS